ncbi:MAG: ATP-binding protein [Anabaena sp. CoA2_C59]|jgi:ABC-type dipeptide/oligopeptide/nickel transport system ATPase component|uniref:ATP-binding protein n=2 Tax=Aphanizomenon flos-aquae TaxID=1176 RepID=A0ABR8IPQ2_APHFL|nr:MULTISPECIES: AAA family ATPase [Aphanizomenon]MCE2905904.1 ATP-binding protein [Anabaena sp. CoA2_C59]MDJ0505055.1 AAA family ATPase [Nostocales cyanobacterium LE14-WE12]MBD2390055.1 ATP-binding protein [Aphanizomenon flos-aquae FACHB-1171]MBD2555734.1 ATP-binding protein [Aphanizomenon flos-aquae FACHB-1290]MBD2630539.1 ATP-binding protein [Aphanizomenon sp. FACHB-1399]
MKIHQFEYQDHEYQWKLEPVKFLPHINLLVGISGVGKTEILKAIRRLNKIANGASLNGVEWNIEFSTSDNVNYHWQGRFEGHQITQIIEQELDEGEITDSKNEGFRILSERLYRNDIIIVERDEEKIILNGKQTPKLSLFQSVVYILNREDDIIPVKTELEKIIFVDYEKIDKTWKIPISVIKQYENSSLKKLKESDLPTPVKLSILYRYFRQEFNKIQKLFQTIFPKVIDIKIEPFKKDKLEQLPAALSDILRDAVTINIKEKRVNDWIENISSGMLKTFMYISELSLSPEGAVILIDEFENSLGVNCIDSVTDLILENRDLQFFITSHHPYIINNISPAYWKIVTRTGGLVSVKNSEYFHISNSRQKAFIDLINILEDDNEEVEEE